MSNRDVKFRFMSQINLPPQHVFKMSAVSVVCMFWVVHATSGELRSLEGAGVHFRCTFFKSVHILVYFFTLKVSTIFSPPKGEGAGASPPPLNTPLSATGQCAVFAAVSIMFQHLALLNNDSDKWPAALVKISKQNEIKVRCGTASIICAAAWRHKDVYYSR